MASIYTICGCAMHECNQFNSCTKCAGDINEIYKCYHDAATIRGNKEHKQHIQYKCTYNNKL